MIRWKVIAATVAAAVVLAGCGGGDFFDYGKLVCPDGTIIEDRAGARCPSSNQGGQQTRGPGYAGSLGEALTALNSLDRRTSQIGPIAAIASCTADTTQSACVPSLRRTVGLGNRGLSHPGNLAWVRPSQVNVRNLVGTFNAQHGSEQTYGGWGEWSYFYTTNGAHENAPRAAAQTQQHGRFQGGSSSACPTCHTQYVLAVRNGVAYRGHPTGTATYNGYTYAAVVRANASGGSNQFAIERSGISLGDATLRANFSTNRLDATFNNFNGGRRELSSGVHFSNVPITSSGFAQNTTSQCDGCGKLITGNFYGPDSQEIAGTYAFENHLPSQNLCEGSACRLGYVIVGSFGGKR